MADTEYDAGYELLPADEAETTLDEDLEALLADALADEEEPPEEDAPVPLGRGWAFDFEAGQFQRHGSSPAAVSGIDHLTAWIEKALRVSRLAHPIYSDDYGVELPENLIGQPFTPELAGKVGRAIEEALLVHDRITQVKDFAFTGGPESDLLEIAFTVVVDEEELEIEGVTVPVGTVV